MSSAISPVWLLSSPILPLLPFLISNRNPEFHPHRQTRMPLIPNLNREFHPHPPKWMPQIPFLTRCRSLLLKSAATSPDSGWEEEKGVDYEETSVSIDALHRFIHINLGTWDGILTQYDSHGRIMQNVTTKLAVGSYGEDELVSLIQTDNTYFFKVLCSTCTCGNPSRRIGRSWWTSGRSDGRLKRLRCESRSSTTCSTLGRARLYIKQPPSRTSISGQDLAPEWVEYKIKETNMFTVDKYQQIGLFPIEKAYSLRYQTAGMLETVLRVGVLGEDDTGEESPKNLKLPSRQPTVVCENCLYSQEKDMRTRAFHIMDPKGILEMNLIFLEQRDGVPLTYQIEISKNTTDRLSPLLGKWKGHSITRRSGVYGATIAEAEIVALLEIDDNGQLIQDITSTSTGGTTMNVHWTGKVSDNLIIFDGGFQMTLLPGGMYMGCPCDIGKSVAQSQSFHLEFCWMESLCKRQRLVRTYDIEGLVVSSTYITEVRV